VTVWFKPLSQGVKEGTLWVYSNDPGESVVHVALLGEGGVGVEEAWIIPREFHFGIKSNPARGRVIFNLAIPRLAEVSLLVYDVTGRLVDKPLAGQKPPGAYEIVCAPNMTAGVYFYRLVSPWKTTTGKLVLIR
jgi:hypothetical protein